VNIQINIYINIYVPNKKVLILNIHEYLSKAVFVSMKKALVPMCWLLCALSHTHTFFPSLSLSFFIYVCTIFVWIYIIYMCQSTQTKLWFLCVDYYVHFMCMHTWSSMYMHETSLHVYTYIYKRSCTYIHT